ncbi:MAG: MerR family transcriptional regulator [Bacteroidales bacterium]|nr:MerR family transcriptional regulator [Bacteroidales bacterium]
MDKLYYSISEVAQALGESISCIRFWTNSFPKQLHPSRTAKGNRQYTADDIEALRRIQYLVKKQGLTLEGAQKQLAEDGSKADKAVRVADSLKAIREQLVAIKETL